MNLEGKIVPRNGTAQGWNRPVARAWHGTRIRLYILLMLLDGVSLLVSAAFAELLVFGDLGNRTTFNIVFAALPLFAGTAFNSGAYSIAVLRKPRVGIAAALSALVFAYGSIAFLAYFLKVDVAIPRMAVALTIVFSFLLVPLVRLLFGRVVKKLWANNVTCEIVIFDDVTVAVPPHATIIDAEANDLRPNYRDPMMLDRLAAHLKGADRVVVACRPDAERAWAMLLKGANIRGEIVANEFDAVGAFALDSLCDRTTLVVASGPLNIRDRMLKRVFDLLIAVPALLAVAPVCVIAAIAIKLDSRGPVFFKQKRVGRGNALFEVYKFRSMLNDRADTTGDVSASRDDDRITRVGRFMRRTSIDELPQLLNVLFGSMSIVGPRPHALGSLAGQQLFWEVDERYWHRHALKPGITGLAQVRGFRGATVLADDLSRRLHADLEYIAGWSVWRDCAILASTLKVVVHPNAY